MEDEFARLKLVHVQQVVHQMDEPLRILAADRHQLLGPVRQIACRPARHQPQRAGDGGQRRAQFVTNGRHQFVLQPTDLPFLGHVPRGHDESPATDRFTPDVEDAAIAPLHLQPPAVAGTNGLYKAFNDQIGIAGAELTTLRREANELSRIPPAGYAIGRIVEQIDKSLIPQHQLQVAIHHRDPAADIFDSQFEQLALVIQLAPMFVCGKAFDPELDKVDYRARKLSQLPLLFVAKVSRLVINNAEGPDRLTIGHPQRRTGIETDVRRTCHQRIGAKPRILHRIRNNHHVRLQNGEGAEGDIARRMCFIDAAGATETLRIGAHDRHQRHRNIEQFSGKLRDMVERQFPADAAQSVMIQRPQTIGLIRWDGRLHRFSALLVPRLRFWHQSWHPPVVTASIHTLSGMKSTTS